MQVRPKSDTKATVLPSGELILTSADGKMEYFSEPDVAAIWMSLRRYEGNPEAAALLLSDRWGENLGAVQAQLWEQVEYWNHREIVEILY